MVHILVLETFVGLRPMGYECRHLDGTRINNHVTNLAWGTHSENQLDRRLHRTAKQGEKSHYAKLKTDDVLQIRRRVANGELHRVIAEDFHVCPATISDIVQRRSWKHI